jgi:predicted RND superfamily exporter protein
MPSFFEKRDPWGHGLSLWVLLGMVFLIPLAIWATASTRMENEVTDWLAKGHPDYKVLEWSKTYFPFEETVLLTWEGSSLSDPRLKRFAQAVTGVTGPDGIRRGGLKQVDRVTTPQELIERIEKYDVTRDEAVRRLKGVLLGTGNLRVRLTEAGRKQMQKTKQLLVERAQERLGLAIQVLPREVLPAELQASANGEDSAGDEPASETTADAAASFSMPAEHDFQVTWKSLNPDQSLIEKFRTLAIHLRTSKSGTEPEGKALVEDCFFEVGSPAGIAVHLSKAGLADRKSTFAALRQQAIEVGVNPDKLHLGGRPVASAALDQEVLKALWNRDVPVSDLHRKSVLGLSGLVGIVLAFWMLKSLRLAGMVLVVSYWTVLISTALVPMSGGSMNMVLVVMPTLLLVTTLSGAIHLANYWKHAAARNLKTAVLESHRTAFGPVAWASVTAAIGQLSLCTSSLAPVRDFGIYTAVGGIIAMFVVLYGLPAMLQLWPGQPPRAVELDHSGWRKLGFWIAEHHVMVTTCSLVACVIAMYGLRFFETETKVIRYFSDSTKVVRDYNYIERELAGIVPVEVIVRFDQRDGIENLKFVERADIVRRIQQGIRKLDDVSGSMSLADFLPEVTPPGEKASPAEKVRFNAKSRTIEGRVKDGSEGRVKSYYTVTRVKSEFNEPGDELWRITAQVAIMSDLHYGSLTKELDEVCQSVLKFHPGTNHHVTGMVPVFLATQDALLRSFIMSFMGTFISIAIVLVILMRNLWAGLLAMVPNILPIGAVFGLISWLGLKVDIGTTVTASIALGITIDGTLHIVTWFRLGLQQGKTRAEAMALALEHCGPSMWQTSLIVSFGLLMLYPSELILISRFGWLMAVLLAAASLTDLFLTPALLVGPMGYVLQKVMRVDSQAERHSAEALLATEPPASTRVGTHPHELKPHIDAAAPTRTGHSD